MHSLHSVSKCSFWIEFVIMQNQTIMAGGYKKKSKYKTSMWRRMVSWSDGTTSCDITNDSNEIIYSPSRQEYVQVEFYLKNSSEIKAEYTISQSIQNTTLDPDSDFANATVYSIIYYILLICILFVILKTLFMCALEKNHYCNTSFFSVCVCSSNSDPSPEDNLSNHWNDNYYYKNKKPQNSSSDCCISFADACCTAALNAVCNACCECLLRMICSCWICFVYFLLNSIFFVLINNEFLLTQKTKIFNL